jgi:hypothetical protein
VEIGRSPSTISRELRRNAATRGGKLEYRASVAQWKAELVARRPKTAKLAADERLREYVQDRLAGKVRRPDGTAVAGPAVKGWKGRNKPRRQDRRWATAWSPEQISARLRIDFPDDPSMRISHEAIYQSLFVQGRGALARELTACLRTGRALRVPRARVGARGKGFISEEVMISQRPAEAADRAVPGHWEGDLIIGTGRSAIGTLVERSSRFTMLLHLPPLPGRDGPRVKNGPAVTGAGAEAVRDAIAAQLGGCRSTCAARLPGTRRRTGPARQAEDRPRPAGVLLRPAEPLAARHQREHQRAAQAVLPQGHRPRAPQPRRPGRRRRRAQQPPTQDARMAHPRRGARRVPGRCGLTHSNTRSFKSTAGPRSVARATIAAAASPYGLGLRDDSRAENMLLPGARFHSLPSAHR